MRRLNSEFITKYISEAGSERKNKNYFGFAEMDEFACWVIAESYDNDPETLSAKLAVDTVISCFNNKPSLSKRRIKKYIKEADRQLKLQSVNYDLKASVLVVVSNYKKVRYAVCGNCHIHIFRGNGIFTKSKDTSLYQELIEQNKIPDDGIKGIEHSRNLFDYLGRKGKIKISVSKKLVLADEDIMLLSTWGFWEEVTTVEMLDALEGIKEPLEYLDELQDLLLSKQDGKVNNYTIAAIFANKTFKEKDNRKKIIKIIVIVTVIVLIIAIIIAIVLYRYNKKQNEIIETVNLSEEKGNQYVNDFEYDKASAEYGDGITKGDELSKNEENQEIKDRLSLKQRISGYLGEAEVFFDEGNYEKAEESYNKALKEIEKDDVYKSLFNEELLNEKILLCVDYKYIDDLVCLAYSQALLKDYENSLKNYEEAIKLASEKNNKKLSREIYVKKEEAESQSKTAEEEAKQKEGEKSRQEQETKEKEIGSIELEGDMAVTNEEFALAIDYYNQALEAYKEIDSAEKAAEVQKKIAETNNMVKEAEDEEQELTAEGYVVIADNFMLENKFDEAIGNYKLARDIYSRIKKSDKVIELSETINNAVSKQKENEITNMIIEIKAIETKGDEALKAKKYDEALEYYNQAKILYQGINRNDEVQALGEKIKSTRELMDKMSADENLKESI